MIDFKLLTIRIGCPVLLIGSLFGCSDPAIIDDAGVSDELDLFVSSPAHDAGAGTTVERDADLPNVVADAEVELESAEVVDDFIRGLGELGSDAPAKTEQEPSEAEVDGDYRCITREVSETSRQEQMIAYQANSEALWVGALIRGSSIADGLLTQVVTPRNPLGFSISLESLDGSRSGDMQAPSLSEYRDEMQRILSVGVTGSTPAQVFSEVVEVHSQEQLQVHLGVDVSGLVGMVSSTFDFQSEQVRSRFVVNFVQSYYTADIDPPTMPSGFFPPTITRQELYDAFGGGEGGPPLYVSSITYGRRVMFTAESSVSMTELKAALEFAYNGGAVDVSGEVGLTHREVLENSTITAFILGGSGDMAVQAVDGLEAVRAFIESGGDYSPDSPGAPIAYKLAHLSDNSAARMSFTTDYEIRECERVSQRVLVRLQTISPINGQQNAKTYGNIYVDSVDREGQSNRLNLFSKSRSQRFTIRRGDVWPDTGHIAQGVINVSPAAGQVIRLEVHLTEHDDIGANDDSDASVILPFEGGWRHDCNSSRSGGYLVHATGRRINYDARFCLRPIP